MRTRLQRFLLIVLMLALPLQGVAAAAMQACMAASHQAPERMEMADETMADCHGSGQPDAPPAQHECKHCAACTLASALPIPVTDSMAIVSVPRSFASQPAASFSGFVPDGPERPPRLPLA